MSIITSKVYRLSLTVILVFAMTLTECASGASSQAKPRQPVSGDHSMVVRVNDAERHYVVHVPTVYDGKKPVPLVIMFHGLGGTAQTAMKQTRWAEKADEKGFLAVFPEGVRPNPSKPARFRGNPQSWNDGSGRFSHADDVGFINALLNDLSTRFNIDLRRIFATGFSNGASMTFRVGVALSDRLAAVAPVSGPLWIKDQKLRRPVSLIYIIGTADPFNPLEGGIPKFANGFPAGVKPKPPVREDIKEWAELLDCPSEPKGTIAKDGVKGIVYTPCKDNSEFLFYTVEGMGHDWPGGVSLLPEHMVGKPSDKMKATDVIWDFFENHPRP